jgi:hypothetical protein
MKRFFTILGALLAVFASLAAAPKKDFSEFAAGIVTGIAESVTTGETRTEVLIAGEDGNRTLFYADGSTYLLGINGSDIKKGAILTAVYDATSSKHQTMIYPPQRNALVIAKGKTDVRIKVGYFDANGLSYDKSPANQLKLNMDSSVKVVDFAGIPTNRSFADKLVAVEYVAATRSLPPQTTPVKITILETAAAANKSPTVLDGTVKKVSRPGGVKTYLVKGANKFIIIEKPNTFYLDGEIKAGDKIAAFTEEAPSAKKTPEYKVSVVAKLLADRNLKMDRFDDNLLSYDGKLKLTLGENTQVVLQDGKAFPKEGMVNRKLLVVYGAATKSLPSITTPDKIIVLFEDIVPLK